MLSLSWILCLALILEAVFGWPDWLLRTIGHPVTWIGRMISALEKRLNKGSRGWRLTGGGLTVVLVVGATAVLVGTIDHLLPRSYAGDVVRIVIVASLLSTRSLYDHVRAVALPLEREEVTAAREAVSHIVGRNTETLGPPGIARAALETLAENASDGVVAPVLWGLALGLPGVAVYKAINTLDSMIGYRNERFEAFGKAAARLDDLANLIPARATALLFLLMRPLKMAVTASVVRADAGKHRSPNAGWPESAMAGALDLRLSGPRVYNGRKTDDPWVNPAGYDPGGADILRALRFYAGAMALLAGLLAVGGNWA